MKLIMDRRDLRTEDKKALEIAGEKTVPIYIFDSDK